MNKPNKCLLIASVEAYSGKSATILGISHQLKEKGIEFVYGKPIGTCVTSEDIEEDVNFIASAVGLNETQIKLPLLLLTEEAISKRLQGIDTKDYGKLLQDYVQSSQGNLLLLEGPGSLYEGSLFNLSVEEIVKIADVSVLLVVRYTTSLLVESLLRAKNYLGDRLIGVLINDIPSTEIETCQNLIKPFLEKKGIELLGMLPRNNLLRSVSVREIAKQLSAKIITRPDRLDLMVESLAIGAMNVTSALEYFRQRNNMAVITGGGRTDIQLAALETSTSCLILTGHTSPQPEVISRAEYLEVPILGVEYDTLTTVEIVDRTFGQVRLQETIKVKCIQELMKEHFAGDRLLEKLNLKLQVKA